MVEMTLMIQDDTQPKWMTQLKNCEASIMELDENGNIRIVYASPNISEKIKHCIDGDMNAFYFERSGKCAIYVDAKGATMELVCNPAYYEDDRYSLFLEKKELTAEFQILDTRRGKTVSCAIKKIPERAMQYIRKALDLNSQFSREEMWEWTKGMLEARTIKENVKTAISIGKLYHLENVTIVDVA